MSGSSVENGFHTKCIHAGSKLDDTRAVATPIYQTSTFSFPDTDTAAATFIQPGSGYIYSRCSNPTISAFERRIAELEHGAEAVAFGSGMGAISGTLFALLKAGDHIVCPQTLYSGTHDVIHSILARFGVEFTAVDTTDLDAVEQAVRPNTRLIYIETPANPTMDITDIAGVVKIAKKHGILTVSDNTFSSPYLCNPLDFGVDIVVHSCTKYICGHGDAIAGVVITQDPELAAKFRMDSLMNLGAAMAPNTAFLLIRGLKTMGIRVERHCQNALKIAEWLSNQPWVDSVRYPFLPNDPGYELASKQMRGGGGVIAFNVAAGLEGGKSLLNHLKLCTLAVSLGECDTLIEHPASMTHSQVPLEERLTAGLTDGLIRMAVGLEDPEDLIADLDQASKYIAG